jgi:hypothetical protein
MDLLDNTEVPVRAMSLVLLTASLTLACSEYDLNRGQDVEQKYPEDTGHPPDPNAPDIRVNPSELDFGAILKDCPSAPQEVTIRNVGGEPLAVSEIDIGGENAGGFSHDGGPVTLEPDEFYTFDVVFTPTAWIQYSAQVEILSNDPDEAQTDVGAIGTGSEDAYYEDVFQQGEGGRPVDILWVVDNSGSMAEEIQRVKDEFDSFLGDFLDLGLDYHMGVITTDMDNPSESGQLQGSPSYIDSNTNDPYGKFGAAIDGIYDHKGSANEKGLDAAKAALTEPLVSGANAGFLRTRNSSGDEVATHIIVVTDEDDSSSTNPTQFASWLDNLESDPDLSAVSAICGDPGTSMFDGGCSEWDNGTLYTAMAGTDYYDAAIATGGHWASICTAEFAEELEYLSLVSQGLSAVYYLTHEPSSIALTTVDVNGSSVGYSAIDGWTWTSTTNAIVFHGDAMPDPSATIRVTYPFDGDC